ncbi:hypothetical protein HYU13_01150, partial [Candidatus Woesearchaeota archaeon]|nr:hypothetical protein [Candidatus Woesearchaeota archaeon]
MKKFKLVCFDVDGTLVDNVTFSWDVFHKHFGCDMDKRERTKKQFFDGKISYLDWAKHDIGMWIEKGARKEEFIAA